MLATPTAVFTLSVLNLLLCAAGLLFVYFDWSAARRREYLYLYFTEEKPGHDYFVAARRHRAQYTRLLCAFGVLAIRQFLSVLLAASISQPDRWDAYLSWWKGDVGASPTYLAVAILPWLGVLEAVGLALLAYALIYEWKPRGRDLGALSTLVLAVTTALWAVFAFIYQLNLMGERGIALIYWAQIVSRVLLAGVLMLALRARAREKATFGLFVLSESAALWAFGAWLVIPTFGNFVRNPIAEPVGYAIALSLLVAAIARNSLNDYESIELSRHRLGRERGVIFAFLKRLGAAFTTDVEVKQILQIVLESALETTEAAAGAIYLVNPERTGLSPPVALNFFPPLYVEYKLDRSEQRTEELEARMRFQGFKMGEGIIGEVAQDGRGRLVEDVRKAGIMLGATTEYMRNRSMLVVPVRVREETLGVLAVLNKTRGSFGTDDQSLLQALADQAALSLNNAMLTVEVATQERLRRDLQIARDIQQRLLPDACPIVPGFQFAARASSALEVGGDYYDFFWVDDDHLGIVIADVSGKGVYAALVVAMIRSAFRTQAPGNPDVRDVLSRVNTFISEDLRRDMFVTCIYGILEISTRKFSWARAGHEPILLLHAEPNTEVETLSPAGFALGVISGPEFSELLDVETVQLQSGDRLLLFTDGLTEAMNLKGEEFGMERILASLKPRKKKQDCPQPLQTTLGDYNFERDEDEDEFALLEISPDEPAEIQYLEATVQKHVGEAEQSDDLTVIYLVAT